MIFDEVKEKNRALTIRMKIMVNNDGCGDWS